MLKVLDEPSLDTPETIRKLYLDLLKRCLTRHGFSEVYHPLQPTRLLFSIPALFFRKALAFCGLEIVRRATANPEQRSKGRDWPPDAETMIGLKRLDNLQDSIAEILRLNVPGDLIETGVWRGGATIFMRAMLKSYGDTSRMVWVADSFKGLPRPSKEFPADAWSRWWAYKHLAVSLEEVKANFTRYGMLDDQVRFLPGWFRDTLPDAPIQKLALLRLDGDMYESTIQSLEYLYPKLSVNGYVIIDDYGAVAECRAAVNDYRTRHGITEPLEDIDGHGVFWQRREP